MVAGLQHDATHLKLKLLELERSVRIPLQFLCSLTYLCHRIPISASSSALTIRPRPRSLILPLPRPWLSRQTFGGTLSTFLEWAWVFIRATIITSIASQPMFSLRIFLRYSICTIIVLADRIPICIASTQSQTPPFNLTRWSCFALLPCARPARPPPRLL